MKAYGLLVVIYAFEKKSDRDYVTRAELLRWVKVSPKKARALDVRLKKLLDSGWLEEGGARGRYRLSVLARDYILHIGLASRRVIPYFTTEKMPTRQVILKAKVPYVEFMNNEGFFATMERNLARKDYEMI
ncbi:MAG: hypothetical protein FJ045_06030, partial [Crenarchaeota archaeon]|nr:hypothetical protein [Thermoproteota archaeon]